VDIFIRNCSWGYKCPQAWESLQETSVPLIRYCDTCASEVHHCSTQSSLMQSIALNRCVSFNSELLASDSDLEYLKYPAFLGRVG